MKGRYNIARIRGSCSYTVQDICRLFGIHKNTVREWFRIGLPKTDMHHPYLIHGKDLKEFLGGRQKSRRKKCAMNEFYCFRCRLPRRSMGNMTDIQFRNKKTIMLTGICETCETHLKKLQAIKELPKIFQTFEIPKQQQEHIRESLQPSLKCYLEEDLKR